ncbi:2-octaprenyl-3-methyl-6-methoxy-1,4-benzoquinol hydroxylase [Pseudomonas sp. DC3000-4b1]|uniref:2-octaprenyl-3-methyl-6-methoxy-1,4-benzoquinol hydroxylase n=1 Tax=unclassified Pseudomonas TaxID=196821 RepID=UPI003CECE53B
MSTRQAASAHGHPESVADIAIVGAGMVGSTLALALADSGLKVILIDGGDLSPRPFLPKAPFEPRVSALSTASQRMLERLGAWPGIVARRASPYTDMRVWDGSGTGAVHFSAANVHAHVLGHIVENSVVQDALIERLLQRDIVLLAGLRVEGMRHSRDDRLLSLADGSRIRASLVVAADGANSAIRQLAGCATREWDYLHHAIVTSVQTEQSHRRTAWQRFGDDGPLAFLPLQASNGEHWSSIVWSTTPDEARRLMALDTPGFCAALGARFEYRLGRVLGADTRLCIPLRQRHARRYVEPGLALIGDAAHTIHPLAGQGVNLGLLDAAVLAEELLQAHRRGERLADVRVLSRYERRRMPHNLALMAAMEGFERLFQADPLPLRWLRNAGLSWVDGLADAKALFVRQALGLAGDLPALARGDALAE